MLSVAALLGALLLAGSPPVDLVAARPTHPAPTQQVTDAPPAPPSPLAKPGADTPLPAAHGTPMPDDARPSAPADGLRDVGVKNSETNPPNDGFHLGEYWLIIAAGVAFVVTLFVGYLFYMRKPEPVRRSYGLPFAGPTRPREGATVASLSQELADMGDRLLLVESQLRILSSRLRVAPGERDDTTTRVSENSWLGSLDNRAPPIVEKPPVQRQPAASTMPSSETIARLLREYAAVVAQRASNCEDFIARYSVQAIDRTGSQGQFALTQEGSDLWAVPVDGDRATLWALLPGKDTIKRWSYLAAMNGSGAAERLNGAFEFVRGGDATLQVSSPAFASSQDRKLFKVVQPGKLSGIA